MLTEWALEVCRIASLSLFIFTSFRVVMAAVTWIEVAATRKLHSAVSLVMFTQPLWAASDGLLLLWPPASFLLLHCFPLSSLPFSYFSLFSFYFPSNLFPCLSFSKNSLNQSTNLIDTLLQGKQRVVRGFSWVSTKNLCLTYMQNIQCWQRVLRHHC